MSESGARVRCPSCNAILEGARLAAPTCYACKAPINLAATAARHPCALCAGAGAEHTAFLRETTLHGTSSPTVTRVQRSDRPLRVCRRCRWSVVRLAWERRIVVAACVVVVAGALGTVGIVADELPRGVLGGLLAAALVGLYGVAFGGSVWLGYRSGRLIDRAPQPLRTLVSGRRAVLPASATFTLEADPG